MKDLNELSKLVADMVCKSLLQIIGENINSDSIVENCQTDSDYKNRLFEKLKTAFPEEFAGGGINKESVTEFMKNVSCSDLCDILNDSNQMTTVTEQVQDDCVDDFFSCSDANDIVNRCSSGLEDDLREYFLDDFKDRAKDAIDNM